MNILHRGFLIAVEGIDGAGKSTLAHALAVQLHHQQLPVLLTKEPGDTPLGKTLRTLLQEKTVPVSNMAEYLLFAADRAQHFQDVVLPALANNMLVISDRMADSSLVYQGCGRGLNKDMIHMINQWTMHKRNPDATIYMRISVELAFKRLKERGTLSSFEKEAMLQKVLAGFDALYENRSDVLILDGTQSQNILLHQAIIFINHFIKSSKQAASLWNQTTSLNNL